VKQITSNIPEIGIPNAAIIAAALCSFFAAGASAKCGFSRATDPNAALVAQAMNSMMARMHHEAVTQGQAAPHPEPRASDNGAEPSIVGLWTVTLVQNGQAIGQAFETFAADGNEILNDSSAPATGNVCLGVWQKSGPFTYKLNHPSFLYDNTNTNLIGFVFIRDQVTLDPHGNTYTGAITIDVYDLSGNQLDHETGQIRGRRILPADDPSQDIAPASAGLSIVITGPGASASNTFQTVSSQVTLDASSSSGAGPLTFSWSTSPGFPPAAIVGAGSATPIFQLPLKGTYQFTVTVTDASGIAGTAMVTVSYV
jgi:hypothetical protein